MGYPVGNTSDRKILFKDVRKVYWDIESFSNVFMLSTYNEYDGHINIWYLVDPGELADEMEAMGGFNAQMAVDVIARSNPAWFMHHPEVAENPAAYVTFWDLAEEVSNIALAEAMGMSTSSDVNAVDPTKPETDDSLYAPIFRPVCDTDSDFDPFEKHPYIMSYNGKNYDTTVLAYYLWNVFAYHQGITPKVTEMMKELPDFQFKKFEPMLAAEIRAFNDELFTYRFRKYMPKYLTDGPLMTGDNDDDKGGWNHPANLIRWNMIRSGRHIDVAVLNEKQKRVALKRLLGMLGYQILESDKLHGFNATLTTFEQLVEAMAYNVSDVVNLHNLAKQPTYQNAFNLKADLMRRFPETVYDRAHKNAYEPVVSPTTVRRARLTIDSTSAKFSATILCPYDALKDIPGVSYQYPHPLIAMQYGITPVNVVDFAYKRFHEQVTDPVALENFDKIYRYYKNIEGRNFNSSMKYMDDHTQDVERINADYMQNLVDTMSMPDEAHAKFVDFIERIKGKRFLDEGEVNEAIDLVASTFDWLVGSPSELGLETNKLATYQQESNANKGRMIYNKPLNVASDIAKVENNIAYYHLDGTPSSCFATFSVGGIHGAEANPAMFEVERAEYNRWVETLHKIQQFYPDAKDFRALCVGKVTEITLPDGEVVDYRPYLDNKTKKAATYKAVTSRKEPTMFVKRSNGTTVLHKRFAYTSIDYTQHEDFSSYYPNMLRFMRAFFNAKLNGGEGADRVAELYAEKERLKVEMKNPDLTPEERNDLKIQSDGVKLVLNSATGAAGSEYDVPIRMNNQILSMRLIGQWWTWLVAQEQTFAGARMVSTNTDGVYSADLEESINNKILEDMSKLILVQIEPEPMILVSKDANNRMELIPA